MTKNIENAFKHKGYKIPNGNTLPIGIRKRNSSIVAAEVKYVDIERQTFTANAFNSDVVYQDVPISQPFSGPSCFIAGMPTKGSVVILGVTENFVFLIGYIPSYIYCNDQLHVKLWPDSAGVKDNHRYYNYRKLTPGEIALGSSDGSELFLGIDATLSGQGGDSIVIRNSDHSIINTSLNNFVFSSGIWVSSGIAQRNELDESDISEGGFAYKRLLRDGKLIYQLKVDDDNALSKYYTEYLIEAQEHGSAEIPSNSVNESIDSAIRRPVGVLSLGNFIGNNPKHPRTYAKVLGVKLFSSPDDTEGGFEFKVLRGEEPEKYGMAAMLYAPKRENYELGGFFGIDKEGHLYQYLPSATGGGLGSGRSMSVLAHGSKKEVWGSDSSGNSWDMFLKGGLKWHVGLIKSVGNYSTSGRSIHIVSDGPAYYQYGTAKPQIRDFDETDKIISDVNAYKKVEKIGGKERREISGSSEEIIGGSQRLRITGMKTESISGSASRYVGGDYNIQVGTSYSLKVSGEGQEGFKEKKITCTNGGHELTIFTKGDIKETIKVQGNREVNITTGNIRETIVTRGSRRFRTTSGNYEVNIATQGNIKNQTTAGNLIHKTKAGSAELNATLQVKIKTKAAMDIRGAKIKIKTATPASGVVTKLSHLDYITGAPLQNSKTVSISG